MPIRSVHDVLREQTEDGDTTTIYENREGGGGAEDAPGAADLSDIQDPVSSEAPVRASGGGGGRPAAAKKSAGVRTVTTNPPKDDEDAALANNVRTGSVSPEQALKYFQESFPWLTSLPTYDPRAGMWMFPDIAPAGTGNTYSGVSFAGEAPAAPSTPAASPSSPEPTSGPSTPGGSTTSGGQGGNAGDGSVGDNNNPAGEGRPTPGAGTGGGSGIGAGTGAGSGGKSNAGSTGNGGGQRTGTGTGGGSGAGTGPGTGPDQPRNPNQPEDPKRPTGEPKPRGIGGGGTGHPAPIYDAYGDPIEPAFLDLADKAMQQAAHDVIDPDTPVEARIALTILMPLAYIGVLVETYFANPLLAAPAQVYEAALRLNRIVKEVKDGDYKGAASDEEEARRLFREAAVAVISAIPLGAAIGKEAGAAAELEAKAEQVIGREAYLAARSAFTQSSLDAIDKANALEEVLVQINAADKNFLFQRYFCEGGSAFFKGDARPFGLIVDAEGFLWKTDNFLVGGQLVPLGTSSKLIYRPNWDLWIKLL